MPINFNFKRNRNQPEGKVSDAMPTPGIPKHLCTQCPGCDEMIFNADIDEELRLCPKCGHHFRLPANKRIALVCDRGSFTPWDEGVSTVDSLDFPGYKKKMQKSRLASDAKEAVLTGEGKIGGVRCAVFAMDSGFMMGSMGSVVGEKVTRLFERAIEKKLPVVGFTASGGARMQEGTYSLMQMAKTSGAVKLHSDAGLLYITVFTDPTTGGVTASFAMAGDILLAEPGALIAFAGPRVIEQTIRQKLPKGFQRAEYLLEHGFLDAVVARPKLKKTLGYILKLHAETRDSEGGA